MTRDLESDYAAAGFGGRLPFGARPAVLNVDIVNAYVDPGSPLFAAPFVAALHVASGLSAAARTAGIPVIFTNVAFGPGGADGGLFFKKVPALACFLPGSPLGAFPKELQPARDDVVVTKQYASAFFGTSLGSTLNAMRIDTLLIAGFSTSGCIRATALDALQSGFVPYVVSDACGDRDHRPHAAALFDLQAKYAEVVNERDALVLIERHKQLSKEPPQTV